MIEPILPAGAVVVEARDDETAVELFPEEQAALGNAVAKRSVEFTTARGCAHRALERLGLEPAPVPSGERGEPRWPAGVVGSITHCADYRAAVVARDADLLTIGIDAEPHEPLPQGLIGDIARPEEMGWLGALASTMPATHWDRLLFSAKEAVYKAWFPLAGRWLGFEDAVLSVHPGRRTFSARLLVPGAVVEGSEVNGFEGRWLVEDGLVLTAIAVTR